MYLIGDIGNTETKILLFSSKKKIKKRIILKTKLISKIYLLKKFKFLNSKKKKINKILFSSVVPRSYKLIKSYFNKKLKKKCYELKQIKLKNLIKIRVNNKQIGSDRLANAISVIDYKNNFIIVDFGTATTFDVVIKNTYLGGVIAPGVSLSLEKLISKASLIPKIKLSRIRKVIGKNTSTAVKSGFYWGYTGLVNNIISLIRNETNKNFKIITTGGFSNLFNKAINHKTINKKDLTINGLLKLASQLK